MAKHGGKRSNAGRKKGSINQRTRVMVAKAEKDGIMPLDVMLTSMRSFWQAGDMDKACQFAKDAAPYTHARIASVEHSEDPDNPFGAMIFTGVERDGDPED